MAKLVRATQKLFGQTAGFQRIGVFGSLQAGAPAYSTDAEVIQSLSNFLGGLDKAVMGGNSPAIQDINALFYLYAYQLVYLFQSGIPEWDDGTTYFIGSIVTNSLGVQYRSIADDNLNNALTDGTKWVLGSLTAKTAVTNITVPVGYNLTSANLTIGNGITYVINGSFEVLNTLTITGTGLVTITGSARIF